MDLHKKAEQVMPAKSEIQRFMENHERLDMGQVAAFIIGGLAGVVYFAGILAVLGSAI